MDSQQNFPSNSASDQNQPNPSFNANNMGPAPFPPASFGTPQPATSPSQFPKSVNEAFNIPSQPASFTQPVQPAPTMPISQPFSPVTPTTPVPPPPSTAPEIGIRTMQSDEESLRMTGGAEAAPQVFPAAPAGPSEPVFTPDIVNLSGGKPEMPKKSGKGLVIVLISLVLVAGLFLIFKYLLLPRICPTTVCETCPVSVVTEQPEPTPIVPEVPAARTHASYFTIPADQTETVQVGTADLPSIKEGIAKIPAEKIKASTVVEAVIADNNGPITFVNYMKAMFPGDLSETDLNAVFEEDFTSFVYYDASSNPFPGFIVKQKPDLLEGVINVLRTKFEASKQFANLFLTETGNFGAFDNGSIDSTKVVRFARGSNSQRIEYGFYKAGDASYWVVTTSYNAIKEAVRRLGV